MGREGKGKGREGKGRKGRGAGSPTPLLKFHKYSPDEMCRIQ